MRKTNDEIILKMRAEGKTLREIGQHFGASATAIHKRLRRLSVPVLPESMQNLTEKERSFCFLKARGATNTKAVMETYECTSLDSAKSFGSELMKREEIQTAIADLMDNIGLTRYYRIGKLKGHVDNRNPDVSLKALDMSFKLDSSYPPQRSVILTGHVKLTPSQIQKVDEIFEKLVSGQKLKEFETKITEIERDDQN